MKAKTNVQSSTRRNGLRMSGSWMTRLKLRVPTYVFQPGSSSWPFAAVNEPRPLSVKTVPSLMRTNSSFAAS